MRAQKGGFGGRLHRYRESVSLSRVSVSVSVSNIQERFVKVDFLVKDFHGQRLAYSMVHRHGVVGGGASDHPLHRVEGGHGIVQFSVIVSWEKVQMETGTLGNPNVAASLDTVIQTAMRMATVVIATRRSLEAIRVVDVGVW